MYLVKDEELSEQNILSKEAVFGLPHILDAMVMVSW